MVRLRKYTVLDSFIATTFHLQLIASGCAYGMGWMFYSEFTSHFTTGFYLFAAYFFLFSLLCVWGGPRSRNLHFILVLLIPVLIMSLLVAFGMLFRTKKLLATIKDLDVTRDGDPVAYLFFAAHVSVWRVVTLMFAVLHFLLFLSLAYVLVRRRRRKQLLLLRSTTASQTLK